MMTPLHLAFPVRDPSGNALEFKGLASPGQASAH